MDPDSGKFVPLDFDETKQKHVRSDGSNVPSHWTTFFDVGEELVIRGHVFSVDSIRDDKILLKGVRQIARSQKEKNQAKRRRKRR